MKVWYGYNKEKGRTKISNSSSVFKSVSKNCCGLEAKARAWEEWGKKDT